MNIENPKKFEFSVEDQPVAPAVINVPNHSFATSSSPATENINRLRKLCKFIKWSCILLSLIGLVFLIPGAYPLLATVIFPLLGFFGAYYYQEYLIKLFSIYLVFLVIIQVFAMIFLRVIAFIVLMSLSISFEIAILIVSIKTFRVMESLTAQDWLTLH